MLANVAAGMLLIFDLGFLRYTFFDQLAAQQVGFITRAAKNTATQQIHLLQATSVLRDQIVRVGCSKERRCAQPLRPAAVLHRGEWYRYPTNVLDPAILPAEYVVALYWQRWRVEDAFAVVKRVLGLAYCWAGAANGIQVRPAGTRLRVLAALRRARRPDR